MPRRREIDPALLAAARRGELTNANTRAGTPERQAVDRVKYLRRRAAHPERSARQALAHPAPGDRPGSISFMVDDPPRFVLVEGLSGRDLRRAGRYGRLARELESGRLSHAAFRRQVGAWRPIAGFRFLSDPDAVLALVEDRRAADLEIFYYDSGRAA